jgi:hypothetical protein
MKHADFDTKAKNYEIFRVQDYCWKEHGFELVRRFLPDAAILLEEEFDHIFNMTYNMYDSIIRNLICYLGLTKTRTLIHYLFVKQFGNTYSG